MATLTGPGTTWWGPWRQVAGLPLWTDNATVVCWLCVCWCVCVCAPQCQIRGETCDLRVSERSGQEGCGPQLLGPWSGLAWALATSRAGMDGPCGSRRSLPRAGLWPLPGADKAQTFWKHLFTSNADD